MTLQAYYKVLNTDGSCCHGGSGVWPENEWMPELDESRLEPWWYGYHILPPDDLVYWLGPAIAPVEVPDTARIVKHMNKLVVAKAKRGPFLTTWNETTQRLFAADCAEHVLHIYENAYPRDNRPRNAIETARRYALGKATKQELATAATAANAANAAYAAYAAYTAAYAVYTAANAAANAAAYTAAYTAANTAAYTAANAAAYTAKEREWQSARLWQYLNGEVSYEEFS